MISRKFSYGSAFKIQLMTQIFLFTCLVTFKLAAYISGTTAHGIKTISVFALQFSYVTLVFSLVRHSILKNFTTNSEVNVLMMHTRIHELMGKPT